MDTNRLNQGEMIAAISAVLLLIIMFVFKWFGIDTPDDAVVEYDYSRNAWEAFTVIDIVLFITILVAIGGAVMTANAQSVNTPVAVSAITAGLGILCVLLLVFRLISPPDLSEAGINASDAGLDVGRRIGIWLGLITAGGIAYGGWRAMQEEGTSFAGEADRAQSRRPRDGGGTPPPPPGGGTGA